MEGNLPSESELEDMLDDILDKHEHSYGVSVGVEEDRFEVYISYENADLPSIGEPLDRIKDSLDNDYILRADFRPDDSIYAISVESTKNISES